MKTYHAQYNNLIDRALEEDLAWGDVTSEILIPADEAATAYIESKANGILSGTEIAKTVFARVDLELKIELLLQDGATLKPGDIIARVKGNLRSILRAERVALNFLQHLSGIATQTSLYVNMVKGTGVKIADTRKTIPGLRFLEKQSVLHGGGINHRMNLSDSILIKNNHISLCRKSRLGIKEIVMKAKETNRFQKKSIEIEVRSIDEALEAVQAGADIIMLDNMTVDEMSKSVKKIKGQAIIEASGGVNMDNVRAIAETGVNFISVGALTHSARALDIHLSLDI